MTHIATSVATVSLSGSLDEKMRAIADAGFDGFEVFEPDLISSPDLPADIAKKAADLGLTLDLYQPFRDADSADPEQFARNLVRAEHKFDVMEQLGCDLLLVCSSPLAGAVRDDALLVEQMATLAERAHRRGMRLAYEALAWGAHVNTYRHAWDIVRQVDHPALVHHDGTRSRLAATAAWKRCWEVAIIGNTPPRRTATSSTVGAITASSSGATMPMSADSISRSM